MIKTNRLRSYGVVTEIADVVKSIEKQTIGYSNYNKYHLNKLIIKRNLKGKIKNTDINKLDFLLIVDKENRIIGVFGYRTTKTRVHLTELCIIKSEQNKGYAKEYLEAVIEKFRNTGLECVTFETRISNDTVISIAKTLGFKLDTSRKYTYKKPEKELGICYKYTY